MGSNLITKKKKKKKHCTPAQQVKMFIFWKNGPRFQTRRLSAGCPTPWGWFKSCPGSRVQKQVYELATTTVSTSAALIPVNSISQRALIHTAAGEGGKKKGEKSNVLLKPSKAQMPITQLHRRWHKACIVHVGCGLSWECLWWILTVSWPEVTWGSPLPPPPQPSPSKGLSIHLPAEGDVITSFLTSQQSCPSCFERFALWTWCYRGGRGDTNNRPHLLANSFVKRVAGPLHGEAGALRRERDVPQGEAVSSRRSPAQPAPRHWVV